MSNTSDIPRWIITKKTTDDDIYLYVRGAQSELKAQALLDKVTAELDN